MSFVIAGNSASTGYNLTRSLRFRASASAYLNRTPASVGNRQTFTISAWVKRGTLAATQYLFGTYLSTGVDEFNFNFNSADTLWVGDYQSADNILLKTTQVFRDPSAWYHIVLAIDTTQATAANRVKLYVNGSQVTAFSTATYPTQNYNTTVWNTSSPSAVGARGRVYTNNLDGYLAEYNFIDGQALTPSSFGSTSSTTGVWQPARYTGTYGTNGFYLPFTDNSALTTSSNVGLGKDFSGNGNYFTTNNISITAGVTYDSMTDVPTLTSATAANFATLNPLQLPSATLSNGNLTASGGQAFSISTIGMSSGKFYAEMTVTTVGGESSCGISQGGYTTQTGTAVGTTLNGGAIAYGYLNDGSKFSNGVNPAYGSSYTSGDVIGIAFDATAGTLTFYKNNTSQGSAYTGLTSGPYFFAVEGRAAGGTNNCSINFGQRPFTYTPPTGFVALNTYNLPTSTIVKGNTVMDATLYTGNSGTQSVVNTAGFRPDFVWLKARSQAYSNALYDSVRGATKTLLSNTTDAEVTESLSLTAFNSNGFALSTQPRINETSTTYVGWQWQAGQGSTSSNTNGTITSTVSVNASAGFSVVTYTGTLTGTPSPMPTVGHGLGVAPSLVISKSRSVTGVDSGAWFAWTSALATDNYLRLNTTAASASISGGGGGTMVAPTSSVFSTPYISGANINANTYVAYCWTPIAGYSAFGSYTGNGSADGPFVYTGFRPKFVMVKRTDSANNWGIRDSVRNGYNQNTPVLFADLANAEYNTAGFFEFDILSNGFKVRNTGTGANASGGTYIYMAFAESPFRNALAR